MHLTGKIFAVLTLLLAVGAIILTAKTLDKQNEWNSRIEKARQNYQKVTGQIPDAEQQVSQLENDLALERLDWGRQWDNVQVSPRNLQLGQITIGIGRNAPGFVRQGEAGEQLPTLYGFQQNPDGTTKFIGEFRVTQIDATQAALQLARDPRPSETATWNTSVRWRFRDALPSAKRGQIGDLLLELTLAEQRIKDRVQNLGIQQKSVLAAQKLLDERLKELNGNPELSEQLGDDYRLGLVEALRQAESTRDQMLAEVQKSREELNALYKKFEQLLATNLDLEQKLSETAGQPAPEVSSSSPASSPK